MTAQGVLLMTFGAVESLDDLPQYFSNIRGGIPASPEQLADLRARYERIGGKSPLVHITRRQATALEGAIRRQGHDVPVEIGMRFWSPSVEDGVRRLAERGARRITAISSGPYDSRISIGSYERHLKAAIAAVDPGLEAELVRQWFDAPNLDRAWQHQYEQALQETGWSQESCYVLLSAHSLPERILVWNDPYPRQFMEHAMRLAGHLNLASWGVTYQSAGLTQEPWLGPDILQALDYVKALGAKRVLSLPIGFCADHLEILNDLDHEAADKAAALGIEWKRAASLNDSAELIKVLSAIVERRMDGTSGNPNRNILGTRLSGLPARITITPWGH